MKDPAVTLVTLTGTEWERRFKARIVERLTDGNVHEDAWTEEEAREVADNEYACTAEYDALSGHEADPEGAADKALSYWGDGA